MNPIPPFDDHGLLPWDASATPEELRRSHLVTGHGVGSPTWNQAWRRDLVEWLTLPGRLNALEAEADLP